MSFLLFLVGYLQKGTKSAKFGNFRGPTSQRRNPTPQRRSTPLHGMATPKCG